MATLIVVVAAAAVVETAAGAAFVSAVDCCGCGCIMGDVVGSCVRGVPSYGLRVDRLRHRRVLYRIVSEVCRSILVLR